MEKRRKRKGVNMVKGIILIKARIQMWEKSCSCLSKLLRCKCYRFALHLEGNMVKGTESETLVCQAVHSVYWESCVNVRAVELRDSGLFWWVTYITRYSNKSQKFNCWLWGNLPLMKHRKSPSSEQIQLKVSWVAKDGWGLQYFWRWK